MNIKAFYIGCAIVTAIIYVLAFTHVIGQTLFWLLSPVWIIGAFTWLFLLAAAGAASVLFVQGLYKKYITERASIRESRKVSNYRYNSLSEKIEREHQRGTNLVITLAVIVLSFIIGAFILFATSF